MPRLVPFQPDAADYPVPDVYIPTATEKVASAAQRKVREVFTPTPAPTPPVAPVPETSVTQTPPKPTTPVNPFSTHGEPRVPATPVQKAGSTVAGPIAAIEAIHTRRPGLISTVLLWCGAVFGAFAVLGSFGTFGDSVTYALGMLFLGAAVTLACAWSLRCRSADKKALATWEEENRRTLELRETPTPQDAIIAAGLTSAPRPTPVSRQWKKVGTVAVILGVIGFALISVGSEEYNEATRPTYGSVDN
ncbi:hypothetical protein [Corynebacterium variabile]|uniref:hypothetical protein n=1 Tax=Corynebacterium variabile TaxID=1727 RepID=UPI003BAEAE67